MSDDLIARAEQLIADDHLPLTSKLTKQLVDRIKELESAALSVQWQRIESAPRDGTEILVGCFSEEGGATQWVFYYQEHPDYPTHPWCPSDGNERYHRDLPTHWMPLPPPPTEKK